MHILRNIPQSTLGYFRGESLISINELEIDRAEMDHIAIQEMYEYEENGNDMLTLPIAVGYVLVKENKLEEKKRPFSTYIMPTAIHHIKHTKKGMYQTTFTHQFINNKRTLRPNVHWLPYYPWMWYARHIIRKCGIPKELAWRITSYFEWNVGIKNWPNHPCSSKAEKYFLE